MKALIAVTLLVVALLPQKSAASFCNAQFMNSYFLKGSLRPRTQANPMCGSIAKNCCSNSDMLYLFDQYNGSLQPRLIAFYQKMQRALKQLNALHLRASTVSLGANMPVAQQAFCASKQQEFKVLDFAKIFEQLTVGFEQSFAFFKDVHSSFLCALCDYDAQKEITLASRSVNIDSGICLDLFNRKSAFLLAQNVVLIDYFMALQSFLDCAYYDGFYSFPFLFEDKAQLKSQVNACIKTIQDDNLGPACESLCRNMNLGAVSPIIEGDVGFITRATDYFSNLLDLIAQKQSLGDPFNAAATLQKLNQKNSGISFQFKEPNSEQYDSSLIVDPELAKTAPSMSPPAAAGPAPAGQNSSPSKRLRKLRKLRSHHQHRKTSKHNKYSNQKKKHRGLLKRKPATRKTHHKKVPQHHYIVLDRESNKHKHQGRKLAEVSNKSIRQNRKNWRRELKRKHKRLLAELTYYDPNSDCHFPLLNNGRFLAEAQTDSNDDTEDLKQYVDMYNEGINFYFNAESDEINKRWADPFDLSSFTKSIVSNAGINMNGYRGKINFDMNKDELLRLLSPAGQQEQQDAKIQALIDSLGLDFNNGLKLVLGATFKIKLPAQFDIGEEALLGGLKPVYDPIELFDDLFNPATFNGRLRKESERFEEQQELLLSGAPSGAAKPATSPAPRQLRRRGRRLEAKSQRLEALFSYHDDTFDRDFAQKLKLSI